MVPIRYIRHKSVCDCISYPDGSPWCLSAISDINLYVIVFHIPDGSPWCLSAISDINLCVIAFHILMVLCGADPAMSTIHSFWTKLIVLSALESALQKLSVIKVILEL